jgi:hypothetical protein
MRDRVRDRWIRFSRLALLAAVALAAWLPACSAKPKSDLVKPRVGRGEEYVTGMAAAFYCTCESWPGSWKELRAFDDRLHALSQQAGKPALPRFNWGSYPEAKLGRSTEGYLTVNFGTPGADGDEEVAVPFPDCSRFDRAKLAPACKQSP